MDWRQKTKEKIKQIKQSDISLVEEYPGESSNNRVYRKTWISSIYIEFNNYINKFNSEKGDEFMKDIRVFQDSIKIIFDYYGIEDFSISGNYIIGYLPIKVMNDENSKEIFYAAMEVYGLFTKFIKETDITIVVNLDKEYILSFNSPERNEKLFLTSAIRAKQIANEVNIENVIILSNRFYENNKEFLNEGPNGIEGETYINNSLNNHHLSNWYYSDWDEEDLHE